MEMNQWQRSHIIAMHVSKMEQYIVELLYVVQSIDKYV